jgi:hypothetical protein
MDQIEKIDFSHQSTMFQKLFELYKTIRLSSLDNQSRIMYIIYFLYLIKKKINVYQLTKQNKKDSLSNNISNLLRQNYYHLEYCYEEDLIKVIRNNK